MSAEFPSPFEADVRRYAQEKMKKIEMGQAMTILANVGVIAGIVFLSLELQQNNRLLESQVLFNHTQTRLNTGALDQMPHMAEILAKAADGQELTSAEELMLSNMYGNVFTAWEYEYRENQRGALAQIPIDGYRAIMNPSGALLYPGIADAWAARKTMYSSEFANWMDEFIVDQD